jgi:hypothetical protein
LVNYSNVPFTFKLAAELRFELNLTHSEWYGFSLLLYVTIADKNRCSLEHIITLPFGLGGESMLSTHLQLFELI